MPPRLVAEEGSERGESRFANDAMARLWQNAQDRETGAEAVAAIRAGRLEPETVAKGQGGRWLRFLRGR
jgi:hypothetical protein